MKRLFRALFSRKENLVLAIIVGVAVLKLLIHVLTSSNYGYFRDEFYYIAASKHLAFGYVDFPPFIALLTAFVRFTLGDSLLALRFFPALAGAGVILLTGLMARQLGADPLGQVLAALAALVAPVYLGTNALLTMDSFDQLVWAAALYVLILILKYDRPKLWLVFGLVMGIGLTIKVTPLYVGLALLVGLALTPYRNYFRNLYLYLGGLIALAFLLPYVIWNAANGWPTLEFWRNYGNKVFQASPFVFLLQQVAIMHPISLPLWLSGLVFLFTQKGKHYRLFGWIYLVLLLIFMLQSAKNYFLAPFYPLLFASGTIAMQQFASSRGWHWLGWLRANYIPFLVIGGILLAPLAIPMLPLNLLVAYVHAMGGTNVKSENTDTGILPQHFADRFGWEDLAVTMSNVYHSLPAEDQMKACIFTSNYGEAGALQFYSSKYELPPVISGHNNYYLWGPGSCTGEVVIYLGQANIDDLKQGFADVQQVAVNKCQYCMPFENDLPIFLCRGIKMPIEQAWPQNEVLSINSVPIYLYSLYSRYVVGWMVAGREGADLAEAFLAETCAKEGIAPDQLTIHADRGSPIRAQGVAELLADLGVRKSHSRPHVSNDNPFSEARFKTVKYHPTFPERFGSVEDARVWARAFFDWYNFDHHHSGIGLLTPATVHRGQAEQVRADRQQVLTAAYQAHPERFVRGHPQPPRVPEAVWINPPTPLLVACTEDDGAARAEATSSRLALASVSRAASVATLGTLARASYPAGVIPLAAAA